MDECDRGLQASDTLLRLELAQARQPLYDGEGLTECEDCGEVIPTERREKVPGCTRCVRCQTGYERGGYR